MEAAVVVVVSRELDRSRARPSLECEMRSRNDIVIREERSALMPQSAPQSMVPSMPPELPEPSLLRAIFRHFWMVVVCAVLGAGGAWLYLKRATPMYTSTCKITIEPVGPRVLTDTLGSAQRSNYLYTQAQLIRSTPIISLAAEMPELKDLRSFSRSRGSALSYLREAVETEVGRKDDIITVSIDAPHADDAATMANAVVQAYVDFQNVEKKTNTSSVLDTLRRTRDEKKSELDSVEAEMYEFQKKHPTLTFDGIFQQELAQFSRAYTEAQLKTIEARAAYAENHPTLLKLRQQEERCYQMYQDKLQQVMKLNAAAADYAKMMSQFTQRKEFFTQLEKRINELELTSRAETIFNSVTIVEPARAADGASFPRKKRTMAVAIVAGALLGAGLALLRDRLDGRMRSVEEIQTVIGLPILGVVPQMTGRRTAVARAMTVHLDPRSAVAEAYRTIRTAVYFGADGSRCSTILVTSPESGDGKTTCVSNLAIAIAQTGRSVLLLDADFRKPTQHKNLDIKDAAGLSSVLAGRETVDRAIQRTGVEGLDILPCGPIPANPSEILNSREFTELVENLAGRYDHILFDSPPVNLVTDARILGALCDSTILVLRADKSTRKAGEHARNALLGVGARVLGAIVNDAPRKGGYDVYGGSYYGHVEVSPRAQVPANLTRRSA
jgi:capsular exopolysaccharide synthesis family protein